MPLDYACPGCSTTNQIHEPDCEFEETDWPTIEQAYVDVLSSLTVAPHTRSELTARIPGGMSKLHRQVITRLKTRHHIVEEDGRLQMLSDEERQEVAVPTHGPIRVVFEEGSYPGCHDNAVFALIAYFESVGLSWKATRQQVLEWFERTGTWDRGGFDEPTPEAVLDQKQHVYQHGYGWQSKAEAAVRVIEANR